MMIKYQNGHYMKIIIQMYRRDTEKNWGSLILFCSYESLGVTLAFRIKVYKLQLINNVSLTANKFNRNKTIQNFNIDGAN